MGRRGRGVCGGGGAGRGARPSGRRGRAGCLWRRRGRGPRTGLSRERPAELSPSGEGASGTRTRPATLGSNPWREAGRKKRGGLLWTGLGLETLNSGELASGFIGGGAEREAPSELVSDASNSFIIKASNESTEVNRTDFFSSF